MQTNLRRITFAMGETDTNRPRITFAIGEADTNRPRIAFAIGEAGTNRPRITFAIGEAGTNRPLGVPNIFLADKSVVSAIAPSTRSLSKQNPTIAPNTKTCYNKKKCPGGRQ